MSNNPNLPGYGAEVFTSESAEMEAILQAMLMNVRTALPVRVEGVTNSGGVSPIGYVNIRPLVKLIDASSNTTSHRIIYNVPYLRIQGGANAVILDPKVGDIGMATFSDRDISTVKATKQEGPPGSRRHHDLSDAIYMHSIISVAPTQYVRFFDGGIEVVSPTEVHLKAPASKAKAIGPTRAPSPHPKT